VAVASEPANVTEPEPVVVIASEPANVTEPEPVVAVASEPANVTEPEPIVAVNIPALNLTFEQEELIDDQSPPLSPVVDISTINQTKFPITVVNVQEHENHEPTQESPLVIEPPSFDDIEFYDDPTNGKTYYLDSKTKRIFEIAPNDEIGVFVKQL
jgi:hypothetical protein